MKTVGFLFLYLIVFNLYTPVFSQEIRCKTNELKAKKSFYPFQKQLQDHIERNKKQARTKGEIYTIPIIVHVMYLEGEEIGEGTNISNRLINSQIQRLNEDFRRTNTNKQDTREEFRSVAVDTQIQFILADFDTVGNILAERGVVRHLSTKDKWSVIEFDSLVKPQTIWNPEQYLNIWTVNIAGLYLGYGQYPDLSGLAGLLDDEQGDEFTDGVVIDYDNFGDYKIAQIPIPSGSHFNLGRTLTHEIGHYLGLIHIWGTYTGCDDEGDFCDDTPPSSSNTNRCQTDRQSCGQLTMTQNYMDYTWDSCMNLFTADQAERMRTVLEVSPRRKSLLTSPAMDLERETTFLQVEIYPNPSQDFIFVESSTFDSSSYQISNLTGQILLFGKLEKRIHKIDITSLLSGIYLIRIQNSQGVICKKIVIEK